MKKVLLGTSAIALAGAFAAPADAAEWTVRVGGYMEQFVAYSDVDLDTDSGDYDGIEVKGDKEVYFNATIVLDNGLTFGARYQLEGTESSDQIDENYLVMEGSFGQLRLGETDQASFSMHYAAPDVTFVNINSGSDTKWYAGMLTNLTATYPVAVYDPEGIVYYSPRLAGFQLGASYARDGEKATVQSQQDTDAAGVISDAWAVGANYLNSFGDFNVGISGGYATADFESDSGSGDVESWGAGLNLGYGGFTIGGSYKENDVDGELTFEEDCPCEITGGHDLFVESSVGIAESTDHHVWDAGVSYETGPWGFSFTYIRREDDSPSDFEIERYLVGIDYALAQGVRLGAFGTYSAAEDEDGEGSTIKDDGWIVGTGIRLDF